MTSSKTTKRALLTSALAILMCVAMLMGTTFAWFTDSASTGVNRIQSGNLKLKLEYAKAWNTDGEPTEWGEVTENSDPLSFIQRQADGSYAANAGMLWEPGGTYRLQQLRISNVGSLALKYKVVITGIMGNAELNDVIDWTVNGIDIGTEQHLAAGADSHILTIEGSMQETAGNHYQNMTIDGISITVYATQDTVEHDSFDNQYDKDAKYAEVIAGGKGFRGGKYTLDTGIIASDPNAIAVKAIGPDTEVTINDGTFDGGAGGNNICVAAVNGATVIIKGGTFTVGGDATGDGNSVVYSQGGNIVIEGGFFYTDCAYKGIYYVLNQSNGNPGTITVRGGTFVNYDPSKGDDNLGGNFVDNGYRVVSETKENGDVWYTVVEVLTVRSASELTEAIKTAAEDEPIYLGADIDSTSKFSVSRKLTINLNGFALSSSTITTLELGSGADVTITDSSAAASGAIKNTYSGSKDPTTVDLKKGATFTLEAGTVQGSPKDTLYSVAISNNAKEACTVNINGGTVANPDGHEKSRAIVASNGMTVNINGGTVSGGLYALDTYEGSVANINGGKLLANAAVRRNDEYGTSYAIHAKGVAEINVGSTAAASVPNVKGIMFESNGLKTSLPTINLVKGEITNPIYSLEQKYNYELFKLGITAGAPVTFTDDTAQYFLADDLQMVQNGSVWQVVAK